MSPASRNDRADLTGEVALITGGTAGIGKATATELARRGATVAVVGSTAAKGETAAREIARESGTDAVTFLQADLSLMADVRRLANAVRTRYDRLDVLVHSASIVPGMIRPERPATAEGLERSFAVNYLSRFLLTNLLRGRLRESAPSRVILIADAGNHPVDKLHLEDLQFQAAVREEGQIRLLPARAHGILGTEWFGGPQMFSQAQVANNLFGLELAERVEETGVGVAVVSPGVVRTEIRRDVSAFMRLIEPLFRLKALSPAEAAETPVALATHPDPTAVNGRFFDPHVEEKPVPDELRDPGLRERLWQVSKALSGIATIEHAAPVTLGSAPAQSIRI